MIADEMLIECIQKILLCGIYDRAGRRTTCVVDQDVNGAEAFGRLGEHALHRSAVRDVATHGQALRARLFDGSARLGQARFIDVADDEIGASTFETLASLTQFIERKLAG